MNVHIADDYIIPTYLGLDNKSRSKLDRLFK